MPAGRRLTVLIIPEDGGNTYEYKFSRNLVWVAGVLGVAIVVFLALGLRAQLAGGRLQGRVALLRQEKGVLQEQVALIKNLDLTLRQLERSNWQLRQIASSAVGLETPVLSSRETAVGEHYIPGVERLRWGRIRTVPSLWPVRGSVIRPFDEGFPGVAIGVPVNALVRASAAGRVARVGFDENLGNLVELDHGNRITSRYGYVGSVLVTPGQYVHKGQPIALSGASGRPTSAALFYAVEEDGRARDPEGYRLWL